MLDKYGDLAEFLFIYTNEGGMDMATQDHELPEPLRELAEAPDAPWGSRLRLESRVRAGKEHFGLHLSFLLDNEQGEVQSLYSASPKRLLIVDPAGRIALDSGIVPSHDFPWEKIADWLEHYGKSVTPQAKHHG